MKTIHKFNLAVKDHQFLELDEDFVPCSLQVQNGQICLWAQVDTEMRKRQFHFRCFGTGHELPDDHRFEFLGTVQDGHFVWHFFFKAIYEEAAA